MDAFSESAARVRSPLARFDASDATQDPSELSPADSASSPSLHETVPPPAAAPPRTPITSSETGLHSASSHASESSGSSAWTRASSSISPGPSPKLDKGEADSAAVPEVFETLNLLDTTSRRVIRSKRTWTQTLLRNAALYLVPAGLALPLSLLLHLCGVLLQLIYGAVLLERHGRQIYGSWAVAATVTLCLVTRNGPVQKVVSAKVSFCVCAIGGDLIAVCGRQVGNVLAERVGAQRGVALAQGMAGMLVVGGGAAFAVLCSDYIRSVTALDKAEKPIVTMVSIGVRVVVFVGHVYAGRQLWPAILSSGTSVVERFPEKSILFISLLLTALALFLRTQKDDSSFPRALHRVIAFGFNLAPRTSRQVWEVLAFLPKHLFPIVLLLRIPFLVLALRQQLFLRPTAPYLAEGAALRVLYSERSTTGQIVVGESLEGGYRFLRRDAEVLGGRWTRVVPMAEQGQKVELGDSIFAFTTLAEIGHLVARTGVNDSLARTIALTSGLQLADEAEDDREVEPEIFAQPTDRALIIGLSTGQVARSFVKRGLDVDIVEPDPAILQVAIDHFNLVLSPDSTANVLGGADFVRSIGEMYQNGTYEGHLWRHAVVDLAGSNGQLEENLATKQFWKGLKELMTADGVLALTMSFLRGSTISRAVILTVTSVFDDCRAFGDGSETRLDPGVLQNMVIICSAGQGAMLSFRRPTRTDVLVSPLRSHVYTTFLKHEVLLDSLYAPEDATNPFLILSDEGQRIRDPMTEIEAALSAWTRSRKILTSKMWETY